MTNVSIHRATGEDEDAERLTALMHASRAYQGEYASILDGYRVTPEYLRRHLVFMATSTDGRVLGFYALVLDPAELDLAFVADEAQGMGIGRALMEHMLDQARQARLPRVRVVSHPPAERFYQRMGAVRTATVPPRPPKVTWARPELYFTIDSATAL